MADRLACSVLVAAAMQRRQGLEAFSLVFLSCLATMPLSPPSQTTTYPQMGIALLEMLNYAPDVVWKNLFRLDQRTFYRLEAWLATNTILGSLAGIPLRHQMVIFFLVTGHGFPIRIVGQFIGYSWDSSHRLALIKKPRVKRNTLTYKFICQGVSSCLEWVCEVGCCYHSYAPRSSARIRE